MLRLLKIVFLPLGLVMDKRRLGHGLYNLNDELIKVDLGRRGWRFQTRFAR